VKAVVCLPTYNERENLERMVLALADKGVSVLVIDDNSPDGTGELGRPLAAERDYVEVLHRPLKEGLGPAYLAGFRRALAKARSSCSRWTPTSRKTHGTCRGWSPRPATPIWCSARATWRAAPWGTGAGYAASSRAAARGMRECCSVSGCADMTCGFRCYRRTVLETLDLDAIASQGYVFQIESTFRTLRAGFRVVEIPITFVDREHGGSKMSRRIVLEAIWKVPALRLRALAGRL
jgi:dolichol-phosphate mannosyltransferase